MQLKASETRVYTHHLDLMSSSSLDQNHLFGPCCFGGFVFTPVIFRHCDSVEFLILIHYISLALRSAGGCLSPSRRWSSCD